MSEIKPPRVSKDPTQQEFFDHWFANTQSGAAYMEMRRLSPFPMLYVLALAAGAFAYVAEMQPSHFDELVQFVTRLRPKLERKPNERA